MAVDPIASIKGIVEQLEELHDEADVPIQHYRRLANDAYGLLAYSYRNFGRVKTHQSARKRHEAHLCRLLLVDFVEAFERFLKEIAAVCVDHVAPLVTDARFDVFQTKGTFVARHFASRTLGRALCESMTWLDCSEVTDRFRKILADPFLPGAFYVFRRRPVSSRHRPRRSAQTGDTT